MRITTSRHCSAFVVFWQTLQISNVVKVSTTCKGDAREIDGDAGNMLETMVKYLFSDFLVVVGVPAASCLLPPGGFSLKVLPLELLGQQQSPKSFLSLPLQHSVKMGELPVRFSLEGGCMCYSVNTGFFCTTFRLWAMVIVSRFQNIVCSFSVRLCYCLPLLIIYVSNGRGDAQYSAVQLSQYWVGYKHC